MKVSHRAKSDSELPIDRSKAFPLFRALLGDELRWKDQSRVVPGPIRMRKGEEPGPSRIHEDPEPGPSRIGEDAENGPRSKRQKYV